MRSISVIIKSLKEQIRSYWVLLLSLSMGPFFILIYYLITETSEPKYTLLIVNSDTGLYSDSLKINYGDSLISFFKSIKDNTIAVPLIINESDDRNTAVNDIKNKKADALIVINASFSGLFQRRIENDSAAAPELEFIGDLTSSGYLISAVWANEIVNEYALAITDSERIISVKETALGTSATTGYFDMMVPGILIVSLIMLMFTASIAFVSEVENKTIMRLKLSKLTTSEFIGGIAFVQLLVGLASVLLTLITAIILGFDYSGSLTIMIIVAGLTSLSIISFSLIIAALTKSANEVLVVGNFPMFLFMFFTGAAFPLKSDPWFTIAGYPINLQGLMTPTHAISALNKTLILDMDVVSIIPEIISIILLTVIYFLIGGIIFRRRHLKLN
jgi:ABC-2 type transport system permease protein